MSVVIGISGFAQSGKTTVANYIERYYGVRRRHIAEPLRGMLAVLLRENQVPEDMIPRYLTGDLKEAVVPEIGCTSRHLQISLGTEWGREHVHEDLWANTWACGIGAGDAVMNDSVRFPNEERAIRDKLSGFTILVTRRGTQPAAFKWGGLGRWLYQAFGCMWGVHDSERTDRLNPDEVIQNDGKFYSLFAEIDRIMANRGIPLLERRSVNIVT